MFDIVEQNQIKESLKARVSITHGKFNIYLPFEWAGQRFNYVCKKDRIEIKLSPSGERKFSYNRTEMHPSACQGLVSDYVPFQTTYTDEFDFEHSGDVYIIKLGKFREKNVVKTTDPTFDFKGFYQSIDDAGLQPFIHNGEIAFRRKQ